MGTVASVRAQSMVLPEERKGDPAPDTQVAVEFLARGRYEDAIRQAKLALGRDERYVPAMLVLAKSYYFMKKYELSGSILDIAKSVDANSGEVYNLLGWLALARNDRLSATAAFKQATEMQEGLVSAWNSLAGQYLFAKNYEGALAAADKATQLAPNWAKAWLNLGSAYRGAQRYPEADQAYRKALQLDPASTNALFNLGILYLDAEQMPNMDLTQKLNASIQYLTRYRQAASLSMGKDDPAEGYINEAKAAIDRENKRLERLKKQQQRAQPKEAPAGGEAKPADAAAAQPASGKVDDK
jgi:Tfp pilus assembly protein PilF